MKVFTGRPFVLKTFILGAALSLTSAPSLLMAQDFGLDNVVDSEQLDIDGDFNKRKEYQKKLNSLQNKTNDIIDKQLSKRRAEAEKQIAKEMEHLFNGGQTTDSVSTKAAAPHVEAHAPKAAGLPSTNRGSIMLSGGSGIVNTDEIDLNLGIQAGLRGEYIINERWAFGTTFSYTNVNLTKDDNQNLAPSPVGFIPAQQNLRYERFALDLTTRFFVIKHNMFKPYVGVGVGMVRNQISYDNDLTDQQQQQLANGNFVYSGGSAFAGNYQYNPETDEYVENNFQAMLMLGSDFFFNKNFGLNVEAKYVKGFGVGTDNQVRPQYYDLQDDQFLEDAANSLADAHYLVLSGGVVFSF